MKLFENFKEIIQKLYGPDEYALTLQLKRYNRLFDMYCNHFKDMSVYLFSTPGRTEIGGNHTDHNLGRVLAASINLDTIAVVSKNNTNKVNIFSQGYDQPFKININELKKVDSEKGTTSSLIRGIASRFKELGYKISGFNAVVTSDVLPGSGLSSSASIEVLIGTIFNTLYNDGRISKEELAKIGQWAENNYFGKPCGLMDQLACAVGGIISIDFKNPENPLVEKVNFNFNGQGYRLLIVDTGGNHEDLTEDYASIPKEMTAVAKIFGKDHCREIDFNTFYNELSEIRKKVGDRAALRAYHFLNENKRVVDQVNALKENEFEKFLAHVVDSGNSSFKWLQNIFTIKNVEEQGVAISLALTEKFINEKGEGACRIHGGGFAGTILVFLPERYVEEYKNYLDSVIGTGRVVVLNIRKEGTLCLNKL